MGLPTLSLPHWVNLESTLRCNLECIMCGSYLSGVTKQRRVMAPELLDRVKDQLLPAAQDLSLTVAGEPFMTPGLGTFADLAADQDVALQFNSNATLIKEGPQLEQLLRQSSLVRFSIDGATKEVYESIRVQGDFDKVLANVRLVVRTRDNLPRHQRPRLALCMVLMRRNVHQLSDMVDLARDLGLDRLEVAHLTAFTDEIDRDESLRHCPDLADNALRAARKRADALSLRTSLPPLMSGEHLPVAPVARMRLAMTEVREINPSRLGRLARTLSRKAQQWRWAQKAGGRIGCHFLTDSVYVSIGGDVAPCCMPGRPVVGNLLETPFEELWNGPVLTAMREGLMRGEPFDCCAHCSKYQGVHVPADPATVRPQNPGIEVRSGRRTSDDGGRRPRTRPPASPR